MMTSSNGNIFRVAGPLCGEFTLEFPSRRPMTRSFDVLFDLCLNKRLSKQSWGWWFETPPCPLWRHCNVAPKLMLANCKSNIYFDMQERWPLQLMTYNFAVFMCMAALSEAAFISVIFIYTFLYFYIRLCAIWFEMLLLGLKHFPNISCVEWRIFLFNVEQATRGVLKNTPRHGNGFRVTPRFTFKALRSGLLKKLHIDIHVS